MSQKHSDQTGKIVQMNGELRDLSSTASRSLFARLNRLKKQQQYLFPYMVTGLLTLGLIGGFYIHSSLSRLQTITFSGNTFLSKETILELTGLSPEQFMPSIRLNQLEKQIESHPLVKKARISLKGLNDLKITIEEEQVLGCVGSADQRVKLLISNGEMIDASLTSGQTCQGVFFYDMENLPEEMNLMYLTSALSELSDDFLALIEAVYYEPELGDIYRFSFHLKDGNVVKVNTYTMAEKLRYYAELRQKVMRTYGDVHGTFYLDVGDRFVVHDAYLEDAIEFFDELSSGEWSE